MIGLTSTLGNSILKLQRKLGRPDKKNPDRSIRIEAGGADYGERGDPGEEP